MFTSQAMLVQGLSAFMSDRSFGKYLKMKRLAANLSLTDLARMAKTSKQYIRNIENDVPHPLSGALPTPSKAKVIAIANALDWPLSEALPLAGYAAPDSDPARDEFENSDIAAVFYDFHHELTPQDRNELMVMWESFRSEVRRRKRRRDVSGKKTKPLRNQ